MTSNVLMRRLQWAMSARKNPRFAMAILLSVVVLGLGAVGLVARSLSRPSFEYVGPLGELRESLDAIVVPDGWMLAREDVDGLGAPLFGERYSVTRFFRSGSGLDKVCSQASQAFTAAGYAEAAGGVCAWSLETPQMWKRITVYSPKLWERRADLDTSDATGGSLADEGDLAAAPSVVEVNFTLKREGD